MITGRSKMLEYFFNRFSSNNLELMKSVNKHGYFFIQNIQNFKKGLFYFYYGNWKKIPVCYEKPLLEMFSNCHNTMVFQIPYLSYLEFRIANLEKLSHR